MSLLDAPMSVVDGFMIISLILCLGFLGVLVFNLMLRRIANAVLGGMFLLLGYGMFLSIKNTFGWRYEGIADPLIRWAMELPTVIWGSVSVSMFLIGLFLIFESMRWRQNHISAVSIKDCADELQAGIVLWRENGQVLFVNRAADLVSRELLGTDVTEGTAFLRALGSSPIRLQNGTVWRYLHHEQEEEDEIIHELILTNITDLDRKTQELQEDTGRLEDLNRGLLVYNRRIEELVRQQEILAAKVRIHDEMNHLLISTGNAFSENDEEHQNRILQSWMCYQELLMDHTEYSEKNNSLMDLRTFGELQGIQLVCDDFPIPSDVEIKRLLVRCVREAMTNAVKHGEASHLYVNSRRNDEAYIMTITNDGIQPEPTALSFTGGLRTLRDEAESLGGTLTVECVPELKLTVTIPRGEGGA